MRYTLIQERKTDYPNPLKLKTGENVIIGINSNCTPWENWIKCKTKSNEGWIPIQIIEKITEKRGVIIKDYDATELEIKVNDIFESEYELNGWHWGFIENGERKYGWVPGECIHLET